MSQASSKGLILPLTSVRFFAAMYVVILHCFLWTRGFNDASWWGRFLHAGYTAVGFFFTLSGYILAHVYLDTGRPFDRRKFWIARFARAYPLLFVSLLCDFPRDFIVRYAHHGLGISSLKSTCMLVSEAALLQAWAPVFRALNAPSWSLSAEAFFYLLFPFIAFFVWRVKRSSALALFLLFWVCALTAPILVTLHPPNFLAHFNRAALISSVELMPIFRMFEFLAGIALCSFQQSWGARLSPTQRRAFVSATLMLACVLFVTAIQFANQIPSLVMSNGFLLPVYGLAILGLVNARGWIQHLFSHRLFVLLGESSYAIYLLHSPIFFAILLVHRIHGAAGFTAYLTIVLVLSLASFLLLERPARKKILAIASIRSSVPLKQEAVSPA